MLHRAVAALADDEAAQQAAVLASLHGRVQASVSCHGGVELTDTLPPLTSLVGLLRSVAVDHRVDLVDQWHIYTGCVCTEPAYWRTSWEALTLEVGKSPTEVPPGRRLPVAPPSAICEFVSSSSCS